MKAIFNNRERKKRRFTARKLTFSLPCIKIHLELPQVLQGEETSQEICQASKGWICSQHVSQIIGAEQKHKWLEIC